MHTYTREQKRFLEKSTWGLTTAELTEKFNKHFGLSLEINQIRAFKKNHKLKSGILGTFKPGNIPFNKGKKGQGGWEPTHFKKGHLPHNWVPIGSERVNTDGYVDIKVADGEKQKNWKGKHIVIWEKHNGPVPKGHVVIFGDRDNRNFDPYNLILVSRKQLVRLNQNNLIQNDAELTKTAILITDIKHKMSDRMSDRKRAEA